MNLPFPSHLAALVFCSSFLVTGTRAEELPIVPQTPTSRAESPSAPSAPTAAYQDYRPEPHVYEYTSAGWSGLKMDPFYRDTWNQGPFFPSAVYSSSRNSRVLFAAIPPVLGDPLPARPSWAFRRNDLEAQLAPYVNELFYAPLSGLFAQEDLSRRRRHKLEAFQALQAQLVGELRAHIEANTGSPSDLRREDFAHLAAAQAPRLLELADQAEKLRADFVHGGLFSTGVNWNDNREWRLGDDLLFESHQDEARVVRAAAYFQEGLSDGQRQLLRELAIELSEAVGQPTVGLDLDQPKPPIFFSPATARVRLPHALPAALREKVDAYLAEKAALKRELRETIYATDNAWLNLSRTHRMEELAKNQASRIAALDTLAEDIRDQLALLPDETRKGYAELPDHLNLSIQTYVARKQSIENAYLAKLAEARTTFPHDRVELGRAGGIAVISRIPSRSNRKKQTAEMTTAQADLVRFNTEQGKAMLALEREKDALQIEIATALREKHPLLNHLPIGVVLAQYRKIFEQQIALEQYRDYQTAVLEPGLSPAQRRLLFGAALEKLRLPPTS